MQQGENLLPCCRIINDVFCETLFLLLSKYEFLDVLNHRKK